MHHDMTCTQRLTDNPQQLRVSLSPRWVRCAACADVDKARTCRYSKLRAKLKISASVYEVCIKSRAAPYGSATASASITKNPCRESADAQFSLS